MPAAPATTKPKRTSRWVWRIGLLVLLLAVATPLGVVYWYTRPAQLIPIVEEALYDATGCEATIDHARVNRKGEVTLEGVTLRVPGVDGDFGTLLTAERIDMVGEARGLIDGSYRPETIDIVKPVLHLTEDISTGRFNYELLTAPTGDDEAPIPSVTLTEGRIRFDQMTPGGLVSLGEMGVAGMLQPESGKPKAYTFTIKEADAPAGTENIMFTGGFDLSAPSVDLRADHFRFADEQRYFVPAEFRQWWSRLAPAGELPELELALRPDDNGQLDLDTVRVRFMDISWNLDVLDTADPGQRDIALLLRTIKTRLTRLSGTATIEDGRFEVVGEGTVRQSGIGLTPVDYRIHATGGLLADDDFSVDIETDQFALNDRYQWILAFSPLTGEGYRRFEPSGRFALSANFSSPAGDTATDWSVDLEILDGRMEHAMFPLPLEQVRGWVGIRPEKVQIGPLTARSVNGATLELDGYAQPASDIAEVKLDIAIKGLPLDDAVRDALEPEARENLARFFDQAAYDALIARGLITAPGSNNANAPVFALGGEVDVFVPVYRPYGEGQDYSVVPVIQAKGLSALMRDFPYPVTADGGELTVGPDFVKIKDLSLTALTGGGLTLNGSARKGADGVYRPAIAVSNASLPIDPLLLSALGDEAEELLTDLGVSGVLSLDGSVFQRPQDAEPDLALRVVLREGGATPYAGRVTIDDAKGAFDLTAGGLTKLDLVGMRGDARIAIAGSVDWSADDGGTTADLTFDVDDLAFAPELVDVLPPESGLRAQLTDLYEQYEPVGVLSGSLHWQPKPGDEPDTFAADLRPDSLALNLLGGRMSYTQMSGRAVVFPDLMQLEDLAGDFEDPDGAKGRLSASGDITFDDEPRVGLTFAGDTDAIGRTARLLLPDAVNTIIDSIRFEGALRIDQAELAMTNTGGAEQATRFDGTFTLPGNAMTIGGLPITGFVGELVVDIDDTPSDVLPAMAYTLKADAFGAVGRRVEGFRITADNAKDPRVLRTGRGTGSLYGGTVVLEASADLSAEGGVRLNTSIHDTELAPLLKPEGVEEQPDDKRVIERTLKSGLLSASLLLDTSYAKDGPRYGRGSIRLRDAGLLADTPLELWLIQAMNLNIPDNRGFDRGGAEFDVSGNRVVFDSIWLETPGRHLDLAGIRVLSQGLRIAGDGTLTIPDMALDVRLRTEITGSSENLPFGDLFRLLRNELVGIQVGGTLNEPEVTFRALRDTRNAWEGLVTPGEEE